MKLHQLRADGLRARQTLDDAAAWRRQRLLLAGFDSDVAEAVARDPRYDLHAVLQLVDDGCAPALAIRILEPLPNQV
jgi:hypothetical protein